MISAYARQRHPGIHARAVHPVARLRTLAASPCSNTVHATPACPRAEWAASGGEMLGKLERGWSSRTTAAVVDFDAERCDFDRIDGTQMTLAQFSERLRGTVRPAVITGLTEDWAAAHWVKDLESAATMATTAPAAGNGAGAGSKDGEGGRDDRPVRQYLKEKLANAVVGDENMYISLDREPRDLAVRRRLQDGSVIIQ